jgi:hypothetical protein
MTEANVDVGNEMALVVVSEPKMATQYSKPARRFEHYASIS